MTGKNCLNLLVTFGVVFCCTVVSTGCYNPKTITDYPGNEIVLETVSETEKVTVNEEKETDYYLDEEEELEEFMPNDYPFDGQGNFIYNPEALRPGISNFYRNKPEYLKMAKQIMTAVDEGEHVLVLDAGYPIDQFKFEEVLKIACLSNPVVYLADFETEDYHNFTITYPDYFGSLDDYGQIDPDHIIADDKNFTAEMDEFRDYVNEVIDQCVNYQDNDMENARRVYKYLIEHIYIRKDDGYYDVPDPNSTTGRCISHIDVVRNLKNDNMYLHEVIKLYQFILTQLNIHTSYAILDGEAVDKYMSLDPDNYYMTGCDCLIVRYDGVDYICNLYFDYLDLKNFPEVENDTECHCNYFAVGKATCGRAFKVNGVGYSGNFENTDWFFFDDLNVDFPFDVEL